jgi:transcriptional regulator with XRE-family HTH domain
MAIDKSELNKTVGIFIKEKREVMGLTQAELSLRCFGTKNQRYRISNIESNKNQITLESLGIILNELNCEINFIEKE